MDALVEFCRTGTLGVLRKGLSSVEVQRLLGPARDVKWVHGDDDRQLYRYGSLSVLLIQRSRSHPDDDHLTIGTIRVSLDRRPFDLPGIIADELTYDWASLRLADVLQALHEAGVAVVLNHESNDAGTLYRNYVTGDRAAVVNAFDDRVTIIEA